MNTRTLRPLIQRAAERRLARRPGPYNRHATRTYTNTQMALLASIEEDKRIARERKKMERMAGKVAAQ